MRKPSDYSTNTEDWWSFPGLYGELEKAGFTLDEIIDIGDELANLFFRAAENGGWEVIDGTLYEVIRYSPSQYTASAALLFWHYFKNEPVDERLYHDFEVDHFVQCARDGNLDVLIDSWLAGVPVEHILA